MLACLQPTRRLASARVAVLESAWLRYRDAGRSAPQLLRDLVREGDLVVTVGAGDITTVGPRLLGLLGEEPA